MTVYIVVLPAPHNPAMVLVCDVYDSEAAAQAHVAEFNALAVERGAAPEYTYQTRTMKVRF